MPPLVIPGCIKVECIGFNQNRPWANVYHVAKGPDPWTTDEHGPVSAAFIADWYADLATNFDEAWALRTVRTTDISTVDGPQHETSTVTNGALVGDAMPADTAMVISWLTARRGKRFRGRTYLNGFGEAANLDGLVNPATAAGISTLASQLRTALTSAGHPLVVASRAGLEANTVTDHKVDRVWDRQSRRRVRL